MFFPGRLMDPVRGPMAKCVTVNVHVFHCNAGFTCVVHLPAVLVEAWLDWREMGWRWKTGAAGFSCRLTCIKTQVKFQF
jgi:hypothetical protein